MTVANPGPRLFLTLKQLETEAEKARLELGDDSTKQAPKSSPKES